MLRVTKLTDYATLVLTAMASTPAAVHSAADLAERAGLELPTVSKLLKLLAQAQLVQSFRGAAGGYRLTREPEQIRLIHVLEAIEGPLAVTECVGQSGQCGIEHRCEVRANWRRINDVIAEALTSVSLVDLLSPPPRGPVRRANSGKQPIPLIVTSA
jgi:FeS assembly SUF system regulator